ncbi:MAG: YdeI/OmpD-associated family protein [Thermoanaerobaculia bacterium]
MKPRYFASAAEFRKWLEKNHASEKELLVGFYKKASGRGGITYPEAVDEALCFGWIDGVKKRVDELSYTHRFSPRTAKSYWSAVNTKRYEALEQAGRVTPAGKRAFEARDESKTRQYSFEREAAALFPALEKKLRTHRKAWKYWEAQPPGYRKMITWWIVSAKQEATRLSRLQRLIVACEEGKRL